MSNSPQPEPRLSILFARHGIRFAGPDLLDYSMGFHITDGPYDDHQLNVASAYFPCCGTLDLRANLIKKYDSLQNKPYICLKQPRGD